MIVDSIKSALAGYYLYIKFVHVLFVMMWSFSTAVAYGWYVRVAFLKWSANPDDPAAIQGRNRAIEQFDRGVVLEHIAFPVILVTGPLLFLIAGWPLDAPWLVVKLLVVILVFVPMEVVDYYLSHFGGNKYRLRKRGDPEAYERSIRRHWRFLRVTTPLIIVFVPLVIFLSIVKPPLW